MKQQKWMENTYPERYDEISTHCHEDLSQSTPVLEAAD